jgi:hypothetical protein
MESFPATIKEEVREGSVTPTLEAPFPVHHKKNIYPTARHFLLIISVLLALCVIIFLIHQNGKSIYDNGL